jgi:hypothetical protein
LEIGNGYDTAGIQQSNMPVGNSQGKSGENPVLCRNGKVASRY